MRKYVCPNCNSIYNLEETNSPKCSKCNAIMEDWGEIKTQPINTSSNKDEISDTTKIYKEIVDLRKDVHSIYKIVKFFTIFFIIDIILIFLYYFIGFIQSGIIL